MTARKGLSDYLPAAVVALALSVSWTAVASAGWLPEARLTNAAGASYLSYNNARCLVTGQAGRLHLVWYDLRDGDSEIYYKQFNGVTWGPDIALTNNTATSEDPAATVDIRGVVHVLWVDYVGGSPEVYHKYFDGMGWSAPVAVSDGGVACESPSVAADTLGNIHAVWRDYISGWGIFYSMFDGAAWSEAIRLTDPSGYPLQGAIICDDSLHLHMVWDDYRHGNWEIYYRRHNGTDWGPEQRLTDDAAISENPSVVVDSNADLHIFWDDNRTGQFDIYEKTFDGLSWSDDQLTVSADDNAIAPAAAMGNAGVIHLVWYDSPGSYNKIYYSQFDGTAWGDVQILSEGTRDSENPAITMDIGDYPHVVWQDRRDGNYEIYWRVWSTLPKPVLTSIEPDSAYTFSIVQVTDLAGTGFFSEVEVWLEKAGETDIQATNEVVESATRVTCDIDLDSAAAGAWDVVLRNFDLQMDTLVAGFTVLPLEKPEIASIEPWEGLTYDFVRDASLVGSGFSRAEVWLEKAGEESIAASNITLVSRDTVVCNFIFGDVATGLWDVVLRNPDGQIDTLPSGFEIGEGLWSADEQLTSTGGVSMTSRPNGRCIAAGELGRLHVVWEDDRNGTDNYEIYYKMHTGAGWGPDQRLTSAAGTSRYAGMALGPGRTIHVAWSDTRSGNWEIYYKMYDGTAWGSDLRITYEAGASTRPSIAVDGAGHVYLVWQDDRSGISQIYFAMYDGSSWQPEEEISGGDAACGMPAIAVDSMGRAHTVWYRDQGNDDHLYYRMFDGVVWGPIEDLADSRDVYGPGIVADRLDNLHVTWHDRKYGNYEVSYRMFNGSTWEPEVRITDAPDVSANASAAVDDSGFVHLLWADERDGDSQIYYNRRDTSGWGLAVPLTDTPGRSFRPTLAADNEGRLHAVWTDMRTGADEIFYKTRESHYLSAVGSPLTGFPGLGKIRIVPNPVKTSAKVQFTVSRKTDSVLSIYDVSGRLVRRIEPGMLAPGLHSVAWDGLADSGRRVAQGIYIVKVSAGSDVSSAKVIVLR